MPDLIAQGAEADNRWRKPLKTGQTITLGRHAALWSTPWDDRISRRHLQACWQHGRLEVTKTTEARNPIFFRGRRADHFLIKPGEHFVVGDTTFTLSDARVQVSLNDPQPVTEQSYSRSDLARMRFRDADQRIEVLSRLPRVISGATSDNELCMRMVNLLLSGVPEASAAAVVKVQANSPDDVRVLHWDRRGSNYDDFAPSARLIQQAVQRQESRVHVWRSDQPAVLTQADNVDWAFCVPLSGDTCQGWALYVAGDFPDRDDQPADSYDLRDHLKFAEVAGGALGNLRELKRLERRHSSLSQFFSPVVLEALAGHDPEQVLSPREAEVSVLFCDLRGFSRRSEQSAHDLLGLLNRVSDALGVMTHHILEQGGVVGDFHGDAAMGFWGWPLEQPDACLRACRAALLIRAAFEKAAQQENDPLADFRVGIGISTGTAVAGKIGTVDQVKVTVFGPVVNLASRLEAMTKTLRAPILMDETTAGRLGPQVADIGRLRRVARVRPYGMENPLVVSELLPLAADYPQLNDQHIAAYESALDALQRGDWTGAFELLHKVPADDRVKDFLTVFIAQHNRTPPAGWDGIIELGSK